MACDYFKLGAALVALAAAIPALAATGDDGQGAAATALTNAPPEKVAPNVSTTPGVFAPRPTPDAGGIPVDPTARRDPGGAPAASDSHSGAVPGAQ